jgi:hypothetical protein
MSICPHSITIFGLDDEDICCHDRGIDICFRSMNGNLVNYFTDMGFKLLRKNGYKQLSLRRKPKDGILSVKEAYNLK